MRNVTFAATQFAARDTEAACLDAAEALAREAAGQGAQVILLQELFAGPYFCKAQEALHLAAARPRAGHPVLARFGDLARELGVVLPVSFHERAGNAAFNSLAMFDADGTDLGLYRKSHVPQGPGYEEKFYFAPGDTGFRVWDTAHGRIGAGICWDQWFPEAARAMALMGAEALLYPTAIGSEPAEPLYDSRPHWRIVMRGHAGANMVPVVAANRIGDEAQRDVEMSFYGGSFVCGPTGELLAEAGEGEGIALATLDLDAAAEARRAWGLFRDRRPELYGRLGSL